MSTGDDYRKRAKAVADAAKKRTRRERLPLLKKQKALGDMADNEDWLEGKAGKSPPENAGPN